MGKPKGPRENASAQKGTAMDTLMFSESPEIVVATNRFIDVPIIIQYEDTPMLEVVHDVQAGYTTKIPIFHSDGTELAVAKGSQLYLTGKGEKAGLRLRHFPGLTTCELNGRTLFEIQRKGAAALKTSAELFTNNGT